MANRSLLWPLAFCVFFSAAAEGAEPRWPSFADQLRADRVQPRSALEKLIAAHQDFSLLRPDEANDKIGLPPWLRVLWRQAHPEGTYSADDPTGGYPLILNEIHEWLLHHQDLEPGRPEKDAGSGKQAADKSTGIAGEQRISSLQTTYRSESDIRVNYWDPMKIIAAANNISGNGGQAQFYSTDGGVTWNQTYLPLQPGEALHGDPTVEWTSDGTAWATTIGITRTTFPSKLQMRAYKSTDNGATWTFDATFSGDQTSADKQMIWVDHSATSPYKDNLYAIWHDGNPIYMNRRTGPAGSWRTPIRVSGAESTSTSIGADVKTNAYGDVFGFWPSTGNRRIFVVKSTNGGVSYSAPVRLATTFERFKIGVPAFNSRQALIYVSGGAYRTVAKDMVYASWTDITGEEGCVSDWDEPGSDVTSPCKSRIWFSRSTNGGATWLAPVMINHRPSLNDQFNQSMVVDEKTGALAIIYYDTVNDPGRRKADVWYQSSFDDGATWSAPVQVTSAPTDETVAGADFDLQYGDYNGLSGIAGQFFPSWTDRRNNAREEIWTAQVTDILCTHPSAPAIGAASATAPNQIQVTWGNGAPAAAVFDVYRAAGTCAAPGAFFRIATSTAGSPFTDNTVSGGTAYAYRVHGQDATGRCDSGPSGCVQAVATGACALPPAFAGLASVTQQATEACRLHLSWPAATSPCGGPLTYNIYRSTSPGFTPGPGNLLASGVTGTAYTDGSATVATGTTYYYIVRAAEGALGLEDGNTVERGAAPTGPLPGTITETFEGPGGFDNPGWSHAALLGFNDWVLSTDLSKSPPSSWLSTEEAATSSRVLTSPAFTPRAGSSLSFWHTYRFEHNASCIDGGVLEISTDGGLTWSGVPNAAFITGGYNGSISSSLSHPLAGQQVWCQGLLGPMTQVIVDLSSFSGATAARLRWREGNDNNFFGNGYGRWYVDSVTLSNVGVCSSSPLFSDGFENGVLPGLWSSRHP